LKGGERKEGEKGGTKNQSERGEGGVKGGEKGWEGEGKVKRKRGKNGSLLRFYEEGGTTT